MATTTSNIERENMFEMNKTVPTIREVLDAKRELEVLLNRVETPYAMNVLTFAMDKLHERERMLRKNEKKKDDTVEEMTKDDAEAKSTTAKAGCCGEIGRNCCDASKNDAVKCSSDDARPCCDVPDCCEPTKSDSVAVDDIWAEQVTPPPSWHEELNSYSWDQSKKFVRVYVPYDGIKALCEAGKATVEHEFCIRSFRLTIVDKTKGSFSMCVPSLCFGIHKNKCKISIKTDMVVLKLCKSCDSEVWNDLTDAKKKKETARQKRLNTKLKNATTSDLLRDMFLHADDETRKKLQAAWHKGRAKREGRE